MRFSRPLQCFGVMFWPLEQNALCTCPYCLFISCNPQRNTSYSKSFSAAYNKTSCSVNYSSTQFPEDETHYRHCPVVLSRAGEGWCQLVSSSHACRPSHTHRQASSRRAAQLAYFDNWYGISLILIEQLDFRLTKPVPSSFIQDPVLPSPSGTIVTSFSIGFIVRIEVICLP
jgi:hypothetical protein